MLPQLNQALIAAGGWQFGWIALGGILFCAGNANAFLLIRDRRGIAALPDNRSQAALQGLPFEAIVRRPTFWLLSIAFLLISMVTTGVAAHLPAILVDRGLAASEGIAALSGARP